MKYEKKKKRKQNRNEAASEANPYHIDNTEKILLAKPCDNTLFMSGFHTDTYTHHSAYYENDDI